MFGRRENAKACNSIVDPHYAKDLTISAKTSCYPLTDKIKVFSPAETDFQSLAELTAERLILAQREISEVHVPSPLKTTLELCWKWGLNGSGSR